MFWADLCSSNIIQMLLKCEESSKIFYLITYSMKYFPPQSFCMNIKC